MSVRLHDREYEHLLKTEKECLSNRQELRLAELRILELDSANRHLQTAIHEADARVARAEELNKFFRESVGECHLMISRNADDFQSDKKDWESTTLPYRVLALQRRALAAEAQCERMRTALEKSVEFDAVDEECRLGDFHEKGRQADALLREFKALRDAALTGRIAGKGGGDGVL